MSDVLVLSFGDPPTVLADVPLDAGLAVQIEMEFSGRGNGWTDVSEDVVLSEPLSVEYGIRGSGVGDRVAAPGTLVFALDNSANNSAGLAGYYSPGHSQARAGFALGIRARVAFLVGQGSPIRTIYKLVGQTVSMRPDTGADGSRLTHVAATDWLDEASNAAFSEDVPIQINQRADELFQTLIGAMTVQPDAIEIAAQGQETYPYAFDTARVESIQVLSEFQRIAQSEGGFIYIKGDEVAGGTLVFEGRTARGRNFSNVLTLSDEQLSLLDASSVREMVISRMQTTTHPKRVDSSAVVLFQIRNPIEIAPGETITVLGPYKDPAQEASRVGGTNMITPVSGTDYIANSAADGSGAVLTANLSLTAQFGPNGVHFTLSNIGTQVLFVTTLQVRGLGIYDYQNLVFDRSDSDLISRIGERRVKFDMPYQVDARVGAEMAAYFLNVFSDPTTRATRCGLMVDTSDIDLLLAVLLREPSDRVGIIEQLTGLSDVGQGTTAKGYFIQSVKIQVVADAPGGEVLWVEYGLQPADRNQYWILEQVGASELDVTTRLGFFVASGHADLAHQDSHADIAHADVAHADSHTDAAHGDAAHGDASHSDTHSDSLHTDTHSDNSHSDTGHSDAAHSDSHSDTAHADGHSDGHGDQSSPEAGHIDAHVDTHTDTVHADSHNDTAHSDVSHSDSSHADSHSDVAHGDVHVDSAHTDSGHVDTAHNDSHTDTSHADITHADEHHDTAHGDA